VLSRDFSFYAVMDIRHYLDATYLKTPAQAGLTDEQSRKVVSNLVQEAVRQNYKLVMVRPDRVAMCRQMINDANSHVLVGTVIDFPEGTSDAEAKIAEAVTAIENGADELDFVINYNAFIKDNTDVVAQEVERCTRLALSHNKTIKWIIEIAALTDNQIAQITAFIKGIVVANFDEQAYQKVFVKSSTGFYKAEVGKPNGATPEGIRIMIDNAGPLPVKAAGGVKDYEEALKMIGMGVKRIGTSSAKEIVTGQQATGGY
jgi:deoxyribose-phosphate aldolase